MTELCIALVIVAVVSSLTKIAVKKMELTYADRKNQKEGKYVN